MVATLFSLLIFVAALGILVMILKLVPLDEPWKKVLYAIVGLIILIWIVNYLGYSTPDPILHRPLFGRV